MRLLSLLALLLPALALAQPPPASGAVQRNNVVRKSGDTMSGALNFSTAAPAPQLTLDSSSTTGGTLQIAATTIGGDDAALSIEHSLVGRLFSCFYDSGGAIQVQCNILGRTVIDGDTVIQSAGNLQLNGGYLMNAGASNGGAVAINDSAGLRSIYTAGPLTITSDTALTGGNDTAVVINSTSTMTYGDKVLSVQSNGSELVWIASGYSGAAGDWSMGSARFNTHGAISSNTVTFVSKNTAAGGGTGFSFNNETAKVDGKLFAFQNGGVEKTSVAYDGAILVASGSRSKGTITLAGGVGTATVLSGAVCTCSDTSLAYPVKCAVSGTTLTATTTDPAATADVIAYLCL